MERSADEWLLDGRERVHETGEPRGAPRQPRAENRGDVAAMVLAEPGEMSLTVRQSESDHRVQLVPHARLLRGPMRGGFTARLPWGCVSPGHRTVRVKHPFLRGLCRVEGVEPAARSTVDNVLTCWTVSSYSSQIASIMECVTWPLEQ